nr:hypothetical protein [Candidatus Njordarchaeota archaeon]
MEAELIYKDLYDLSSGKNVKVALCGDMNKQTYVSISLSYFGQRKEVSVRNSQELEERAKGFVSTVLEKRKNVRKENEAADELLRQLRKDESVPRKKRKRSSSPKLGRKLPDHVAKELGMIYEPTEEQGVVSIFGKVHEKLGFEEIWRVEQGYPDASAKMNGKLVDIEYEFRSSRFGKHVRGKQWVPGSRLTFIVCWIQDRTVSQLMSAEYPNLKELPDNLRVISLRDYAFGRTV